MGLGKSQKMQRNLQVKKDAYNQKKDALIEAIKNDDPDSLYMVEQKGYTLLMLGKEINKVFKAF
jgi:hypothetical protein